MAKRKSLWESAGFFSLLVPFDWTNRWCPVVLKYPITVNLAKTRQKTGYQRLYILMTYRDVKYLWESAHWLANCPPARWHCLRSWWIEPRGTCHHLPLWCSPWRWCLRSQCWKSRLFCLAPEKKRQRSRERSKLISWFQPWLNPQGEQMIDI